MGHVTKYKHARYVGVGGAYQLLNPIALRTAKTLWSFGRSECNRVKLFGVLSILSAVGLNNLIRSALDIFNIDISKYPHIKAYTLHTFPVFVNIQTPVISNYPYCKVNFL